MIIPAIALAAMMLQTAPTGNGAAGGWVWTLYEGDGQVVFANEVPDTPQLRATFECAPGSGVVRVSVYGGPIGAGIATLSSGDSTATTQAEARQGARQVAREGAAGTLTVPVRTDHPLFTQIMTTGLLKIAVGDADESIEVQPPFQTALRRFGALCGQ